MECHIQNFYKPDLQISNVFPLHTNSSAHVCTLDRVTTSIISSHSRAADSPTSQEIHTQGGSEDKDHCPRNHIFSLPHGPSNTQQKWQQRRPALRCHTHQGIACCLYYSLQQKHTKSQKEHKNYVSLVILTAQIPQSSSWVRASQICLRTSTPLLGEPRSNDSSNTVLALSFQCNR